MFEVSEFNEFHLSKYDYLYLKFDVSIKSSVLTKTSHYCFTQKEIYRVTKDLHENHDKNFKEISLYLTEKGYRKFDLIKRLNLIMFFQSIERVRLKKKKINREFNAHYGNFRVIPYIQVE